MAKYNPERATASRVVREKGETVSDYEILMVVLTVILIVATVATK